MPSDHTTSRIPPDHERPRWTHRAAAPVDLPPPWGTPGVWLLALVAAALGALFAAAVIELSAPSTTGDLAVIESSVTPVPTAVDLNGDASGAGTPPHDGRRAPAAREPRTGR